MSLKPILHRSVKTTFKISPKTGVFGSLGRTFKTQYQSRMIGELFDSIAREIFEDRTPFAYKAQFCLVNVTNSLTRNSIGYSVSPPSKVVGSNAGLTFTFALTSRPYTKNLSSIHIVQQNYDGAEFISYWSTRPVGIEYLTISFSKLSIKKLNLSINTDPELTYVYNTIGILTKNFIDSNGWYGKNGKHVDINTSAIDEITLWSKYYQKSFSSLVADHPLNSWIYCLDFWLKAPNLLSEKFLDVDSFGLYYVMFLHENVTVNPSTIYLSLHSTPGGIKDYISKGIKDFNRALSNPLSPITDNCYAVVHLLESTVEPGGIGIVIDRDYARERIDYLSRLFMDNPELQSAFYGWFIDENKAYKALMEGDESFVRVMEKLL